MMGQSPGALVPEWRGAAAACCDQSRFLRDLGAVPVSDWRRAFPALSAKLLRGGVLAVVDYVFRFLAGGNAHDLHGIADHVGGALLSFRSGRNSGSPSLEKTDQNSAHVRVCRAVNFHFPISSAFPRKFRSTKGVAKQIRLDPYALSHRLGGRESRDHDFSYVFR